MSAPDLRALHLAAPARGGGSGRDLESRAILEASGIGDGCPAPSRAPLLQPRERARALLPIIHVERKIG